MVLVYEHCTEHEVAKLRYYAYHCWFDVDVEPQHMDHEEGLISHVTLTSRFQDVKSLEDMLAKGIHVTLFKDDTGYSIAIGSPSDVFDENTPSITLDDMYVVQHQESIDAAVTALVNVMVSLDPPYFM